jgi:hypothetical protein
VTPVAPVPPATADTGAGQLMQARAMPLATYADAYRFLDKQPGSIDAFFYLAGEECDEECKDTARRSHELFRDKFGSRADNVPLLVLDLSAIDNPFTDAPRAAAVEWRARAR